MPYQALSKSKSFFFSQVKNDDIFMISAVARHWVFSLSWGSHEQFISRATGYLQYICMVDDKIPNYIGDIINHDEDFCHEPNQYNRMS